MDADRYRRLQAALSSPSFTAAADMAAAFRRWNLGKHRDEVRELESAGRLALIAALKGARK